MTILACYTDTDHGRAAVLRAAAEADRLDSDLLIANIDTDRSPVDPALLGIDESGFSARGRSVGLLPPSEAVHDAADLVLQAEQDRDIELIVLGLRRRSRVGKLLLGSHAQRILIDAEGPVLTVKAQ
ncbi:universal stress protein [Arthrobacter sp.]|uniref:universal stress protein n=1 Tax=Arthrobacter sp. TaxID=1667 RepID=UPI003A8CBA9B